jgi:conjugative relaxase-like TrwC/TraI family protein
LNVEIGCASLNAVLRINAQKNSAGAKAYFSQSDYLSDKQEITGNWGGKGSTLLGLFGEVDKPHFDQLCDNINPATGEQTRDGHRVGYDWTWSVPNPSPSSTP